jgi:transcription antitermination factor NusG
MINQSIEHDSWSCGKLVQFVEGPFRGMSGEIARVEADAILIRLDDGIYVRVAKQRVGCLMESE